MAALTVRGHYCIAIDWLEVFLRNDPFEATRRLARQLNNKSQVILVGHSLAGVVLPFFSHLIEVKAEIYVSALVTRENETLFDRLFSGDAIFTKEWLVNYQDISSRGSASLTEDQIDALQHLIFHDCPPSSIADFWRSAHVDLSKLYEMPRPNEKRHLSRHYVVCTNDRSIHPSWQRESAMGIGLSTPRYIEFTSGHCPQLARPQDLATLIDNLAQQCAGGQVTD